uniref:Spy0128 family protein n=1 Tax=Collinsella sp. TaxID=1965294 RepID=UPI004027C41E
MTANSNKSKQGNKAAHRVIAGVLCGASVLSLVLSLVMPPISQAIANDAQTAPTEKTVMGGGSSSESTDVDDTTNGDTKNQNSDDAEGDETGDDASEAAPLSDDAEVEGAAQPADDGQSVYKAATVANEGEAQGLQKDADDYTLLTSNDDLTIYLAMQNKPEKLRLTADISSTVPITIRQNTTIDLAGHKIYYRTGNNDTFITVTSGALTIEDNTAQVSDAPSVVANDPGRLAIIKWTGDKNDAPQSLTYYETTSALNEDGLGTTETTTQHVVSGFGAIVGASEGGSVQRVISVEDGGTLNLNGGMITTPRTLGNNGHVILSQGTVNISGGYVTNGNGGGWGGGLCVTGANAKFNMTGGVIAANMAASGGGVYADNSATLNLSGGVISGNATYKKACDDVDNPNNGYGGGVFTKNADVTINGTANITNNRVDSYITTKYNNGLLGGGGIACTNHGKLTMTGGSVTANYSYEAGGGIYAGFHNQSITFSMTGGTIAGNESANAEGGGLRISSGTTGVIEAASAFSKVYITNNKTMTGKSRGGDWGGGGVFIQKGGRLNVFKSLITDNKAGGWSGGIGACPTGETIVSHSDGAAIYNNTDNVDQDGKHLDTPHYSAGGDGKTEDSDEENYVTPLFQTSGHKDFFLVRNKNGADKTIAVVLGKMLGGGSAGWQGTCDGNPITIDPNGGAGAKYMFGLQANPSPDAKKKAREEATTIISGNYSYTHGGGIMTNGDLVVGKVDEPLNVYPAIKVKANKVLLKDGEVQGLSGHDYQFKLLGKADGSGGEPYWNTDGTLNANGCEATPEVTVNDEGEIVIDTAANFQSGNYDLYLVEVPIDEKGTTFDKTIYKIHVEVGTSPVETTIFLGVKINRYAVDASTSKVFVKKKDATEFKECEAGFYNWSTDTADSAVSTVKIGDGSNPAFKNELAPYKTSGTWTPQVTKKVDGGEMKKFKFELYTKDASGNETVLDTQCTEKGTSDESPVSFATQTISLGIKDLDNNHQKQLTYYIRECPASKPDGTKHEGYKNDTKRFKVVVTATDNGGGTLNCTPTYYEVDANGAERKTDDPTFTNTYSTSLPLSGMSGVTLTYLAGAAVLCAAAAWMHIRRKANAKGGERRE